MIFKLVQHQKCSLNILPVKTTENTQKYKSFSFFLNRNSKERDIGDCLLTQSIGKKKSTKTARNNHKKIHNSEMAKRRREISRIPALFTLFLFVPFSPN